MIEDTKQEEFNSGDITSITCNNCDAEITLEYIPVENKASNLFCPNCNFPFEFPGDVLEVEIY